MLLKSPTVERKEWRWVWWFTALLIVLTCIPFIFSAINTPPGGIYTGIHVLAPGDYAVYYTYIEAAANGAFVFQDLFTTEPHSAFNLNLVWVPIGWLAKIFSLTPLVAFHLARVLSIIPFALVVYFGLAWLFPDQRRRRLAFLLINFGAGLGGWFMPFLEVYFNGGTPPEWRPMDTWVSEAFPVLSAYQTSHFVFGTTLLILIFGGTILAWLTNRKRWSVLAGVSGLLLMSFHPFHLPTIVAVLLVWAVLAIWRLHIPWRRVLYHGSIVALLMIPTTLGQALITVLNPIAQGRADQNLLPTTHWPITLISYGVFLVGALYMLVRRATWRDSRWMMVSAWVVVHGALLYAPLFFQRRLTQGLLLPMAILTAIAIVHLWDKCKARWPGFTEFAGQTRVIQFFAFLMVFGLSPLIVAGQDFSYPHSSIADRSPTSFYFPADMRPVIQALKAAPADSIFLASPATTNIVIGLTQRRGYVGHTVETLRFAEKEADMRRVLSAATTDQERAGWLTDHSIDYILWGKWERIFYPDFNPNTASFLTPVTQGPVNSLYRVR